MYLLGQRGNFAFSSMEQFSIECRKTKTKVITLANHKGHKIQWTNQNSQNFFLPQLQLISQSDWLICHCRLESNHAARVNVSSNAIFSSRSEKNKFLWRWYCGTKQIEMWFIVVCTLIDNVYASLLLSQTFFLIVSAYWASLQRFWKESMKRTSSSLA